MVWYSLPIFGSVCLLLMSTISKNVVCLVLAKLFMISGRLLVSVRAATEFVVFRGILPTLCSLAGWTNTRLSFSRRSMPTSSSCILNSTASVATIFSPFWMVSPSVSQAAASWAIGDGGVDISGSEGELYCMAQNVASICPFSRPQLHSLVFTSHLYLTWSHQ